MSDAISAHGTLISINGQEIAEVRDITSPAMTRNVFDASTHNDDDNSVAVGIRRKGPLTAPPRRAPTCQKVVRPPDTRAHLTDDGVAYSGGRTAHLLLGRISLALKSFRL